MNQLPVLPLVIPLLAGAVLLAGDRRWASSLPRALGLASLLAQLAVAVGLAFQVQDGRVLAYLAGNWQAPFGIALAVDRLSAALLLLTALVGGAGLLASPEPAPGPGRSRFHALFQFQLLGINGAFLTADLFNLFVFFEVLLIASYGLLVQGGGPERVRTGFHYVAVNMAGSVLLLLAVGLLYGLAGTLNMADLAVKLPRLPAPDGPLVQAAGLMLLVVFALKAALLPLSGWLPGTYTAATPATAALFAILTKVGIYAIARVYSLIFVADPGLPGHVATGNLLLPLGLVTLAVAALGALAAPGLGRQASYLVVGSTGTLLAALGLGTAGALAAALFYLVHTTLATAALFLVAGLVDRDPDDRPAPGAVASPQAMERLGLLFLVAALAAVGLPPLAGFLAKALVLEAAFATASGTVFASVLLTASLINLVALMQSGSRLFWRTSGQSRPMPARGPIAAALLLLLLATTLTVAAGPAHRMATLTAGELLARQPYLDAVLGEAPRTRLPGWTTGPGPATEAPP